MKNNNKRNKMNNIKKLGLSALAGSLVAVSAQAGEMSVTGSANMTYKTKTGENAKTFGTDKDVAFTGAGELDNGWNFKVSTTLTDAYSVSSSYTSITMGSLGTITVGADTGGAAYKYDEEVPQAYEQVSDGQQTSANIVGNNMDSGSIVYNSPSFDYEGATVSFDAEYAPSATDTAANDGGVSANSSTKGTGYGLGVTASMEGAKFGIYANQVDAKANEQVGSLAVTDSFEGVTYVNYAYGPVAVGYSLSHLDAGLVKGDQTSTAAKKVRTAGGRFDGEQYSIAFNVNDDLSISYTDSTDTYNSKSDQTTDVDQETTAYQLAYSMGAMSIKAYTMETKKPGYDSDAKNINKTEVALGLAF